MNIYEIYVFRFWMVCTPQVVFSMRTGKVTFSRFGGLAGKKKKRKKSDGKNGQIIGEVCSLSILALWLLTSEKINEHIMWLLFV